MKSATVYYSVVIGFGLVAVGNCMIPSYIEVCHHDDPDLGACLIHSIEALRSYLKVGIPELAVPPLEPFVMDDVTFASIAGPGLAGTKLNDVKFYGASNFQILSLKPTKTKNGYTFDFDIKLPKLYIDGNYEIDTKILTLELKGHGSFNASIADFHFLCSIQGNRIEKNGANYLNLEKMVCSEEFGNVYIFLDNLFNGDPVLGKATNDVINDNYEVFLDEVRPTMRKLIIDKILEIGNQITLKFTYDELFP